MKSKKLLGFWDIWNMSFGFLGIQFGFALQGAFMTRIFQNLGADKQEIPLLWIAAPLTGLLVQPIIGYMSDRTWHKRLGRRRPYFLIGAILSSVVLFFVPYSPTLWIAAGCLWVLDASINISMEPFRALVADKLDESQRSYGFIVQTLIIGIGTWVASNLPWFIDWLGVSDFAPHGVIPMNVKIAFMVGAGVFLLSIIYTIITTSEYPPENIEEFKKEKKQGKSLIKEIFANLLNMSSTMKKLGLIQFFSWFAFFSMWSMANPAITDFVFDAPSPIISEYEYNFVFNKPTPIASDEYNIEQKIMYDKKYKNFNKASDLVGSYMGIYGLSSMVFALLFVFFTSRYVINRKLVHMFSLICGGIGFLSMYFVPQPSTLIFSFICIGVAWGSILSMPYAMLSSSVDPNKMGVFMGIFNIFIVLPQIFAAIGGINFLSSLLGQEDINSMIVAGISLIIAGLCNLLITSKKAIY